MKENKFCRFFVRRMADVRCIFRFHTQCAYYVVCQNIHITSIQYIHYRYSNVNFKFSLYLSFIESIQPAELQKKNNVKEHLYLKQYSTTFPKACKILMDDSNILNIFLAL